MKDPEPLSGVVLAGGLGRRMRGHDKGLQQLTGRPMVCWVIDRFAPQVDELVISAKRNLGAYAAFGHRVGEVAFDEPEEAFANLNNPDDLARAEAGLSRR